MSPRDVESAYDRFLDRAIDDEFDGDDDDDDDDGDESEPDWGSMVDIAAELAPAVLAALAFPPAWCLLGAALEAAGV